MIIIIISSNWENTGRGGSSGSYRKLTEMARTCHGLHGIRSCSQTSCLVMIS